MPWSAHKKNVLARFFMLRPGDIERTVVGGKVEKYTYIAFRNIA